MVAVFRQVAAIGRVDAQWEPPAEAVARAVEIFAIRPPQAERPVRRFLPRLVFDSFREPLPAGMRAAPSASRHVLYRAGQYFIDLRLDATAGSRRVSMAGQVVRAGRDKSLPVTASVLLVDRRTVLAEVPVNAFGEFQLDYDVRAGLRLRVLLNAGTARVDFPVARLVR
jgi:hypothetical protein